MSSIVLTPCGDSLTALQYQPILASKPFAISIDNQHTRDVFQQISEQLAHIDLFCPLCNKKVTRIQSEGRLAISDSLMSEITIAPLTTHLKPIDRTAAKIECTIHFKYVSLTNITDQGRHSTDGGETFRRLAELSNDRPALISEFGHLIGNIVYALPVSMKSNSFIDKMNDLSSKGLAAGHWALSDNEGKTIGMFSLEEIVNSNFELDGELKTAKLYNVGVLLHSNFQRRGVVTEVTRYLFEQIGLLRFNMDGFWVTTRPDNTGVNHIVSKLGFTLLKQKAIRIEYLPAFLQTNMMHNLYIKEFATLNQNE